MKIEQFTEDDIREAAALAYPIWGVGHAANGNSEEFGLLMCEYIVRYGWYGAPYAFKMVDDTGRMTACLLAGDFTINNGYNKWLEPLMTTFNERQLTEAKALRAYFDTTAPKVYEYMTAGTDLYLSFFISSVQGCGKQLLATLMRQAKDDGYAAMYLWTDSSCNHEYYAHNHFLKVAEFKSDEWKTNSEEYLTYIYKRELEHNTETTSE